MNSALTLAFLSGTLIGTGLGVMGGAYYLKRKARKQMAQSAEEMMENMGDMGEMLNQEGGNEELFNQ